MLGNQESLYHYFDVLIALAIDPVEHEHRLRTRPKRKVGDDERNIQRRLDKYQTRLDKFIASGFVTIDNTGPVTQAADRIESLMREKQVCMYLYYTR